MKLYALGDSITQGFMSGAAARTDLAYPAWIARAMGLSVGSAITDDFRIPTWPAGGLPINLEVAARRLRKVIGANIDFFDWPSAANVIRSYMDTVEDCYERGEGAAERPFGNAPWFHNAAVQGYDVADAWMVTPQLCREQIAQAHNRAVLKDGLFAYPSAAFYRTALNVLDPQRDPANAKLSAIDMLDRHVKREGVENLLLWLGSNNALGTVVSLNVRATNGPKSNYSPKLERVEREAFNLWSPEHFTEEYNELLRRVDAAMSSNPPEADWRVFVGTVPAVSIAPLISGLGEPTFMPDPFEVVKGRRNSGAKYFKYYTYFLFDYDFAQKNKVKLTMSQVYQIDQYIAEYRKSIRRACDRLNKKHGQNRYVVVDICEVLLEAAYKRNDGRPTYDWPAAITARFPMVDTRFHHASKGDRHIEQGGLFGLDGVHPSVIGQGLIAYEFARAIDEQRGTSLRTKIDWSAVYANDDLYNHPIELMQSIRAKAPDLAEFLIWATSLKGRGPRER